MKMRTWMFVAIVLGLSGCKPAGTVNDPGPKPPTASASCAEYSSIGNWQVASVDPIAVVGHGAMQDWQGREVVATPTFVVDTQRYYLKSLYMQATDVQKADFQKKQQRLCGEKSITTEEHLIVNAALISWLIGVVNTGDSSRLASNNAALIDGIVVSTAMRERLNAESPSR